MLIDRDTIAAIATAPGNGAIGVIRLSGRKAIEILAKVWVGDLQPAQFETKKVYLGHIKELGSGERLDQVVVFVMRTPHSYTGEDLVEIQAHGGFRLLEMVLENLVFAGARMANPGEFTQRAFFNRKIDLTQAEAVADLIHASGREAVRLAQQHLTGGLSELVSRFKKNLVVLRAQLEAMIDFPEDEDVQGLHYQEIEERIVQVKNEIAKLLATYREGRAFREGVRVAIVGKPNVGKSSLLNSLLQEERAIVHPTPGTTRDLVEEAIDLNGLLVRFIDTAGLRDQVEAIEAEGIRRTRQRIGSADLVLAVFDRSRPWEKEDTDLLEAVSGQEAFFVLNKIDLASEFNSASLPLPPLPISAKTGEGVELLKEKVFSHFVHQRTPTEVVLTNSRHKVALERSLGLLDQVVESARQQASLEFLASDLSIASNHLAEITGEITTDEILGEIFSKFCLGK